MSYATEQDLVERAGETEILEVADRDGDGVADPDVIAAALATADRTINAYLAVKFAMPLSSTPEIVVAWAVSIGRYTLHRDGAPDHVVRDWKNALSELKDAAAGRLAIPGLDGVAPTEGKAGATTAEGSAPVFTRDNLAGFL